MLVCLSHPPTRDLRVRTSLLVKSFVPTLYGEGYPEDLRLGGIMFFTVLGVAIVSKDKLIRAATACAEAD